MLHVYSNSVPERFVAASPEEAAAMLRDYLGADYHHDEADMTFVQNDDAQVLTILADYDSGPKVSKICREWADGNGRGFLCSSEW